MPRTQSSIQAFTRVSKTLPESAAKQFKKRKASFEEESAAVAVELETKRRRIRQQTPPETPTKVCKRAFADLVLITPGPTLKTTKRKRGQHQSVILPISPPPSRSSSQDVNAAESAPLEHPRELYELINLSNSFLSALSLHCAHHGSFAPIDVRTLTPSVTKLWGVRKVILDDLRRCIGVLQQPPHARKSTTSETFLLSNHGNGRICLEIIGPKQRIGKVMGQPFNEALLKKRFEERVERAWIDFVECESMKADWSTFQSRLSLAEVRLSASFSAPHPFLEKGQQRLEQVLGPKDTTLAPKANERKKRRTVQLDSALQDITNRGKTLSPAKHKQASLASRDGENNIPDLSKITATIKGLSLFERIREKELQLANQPAPPTKAELERRAALQRAQEMLGIMDMLATSKGSGMRASFPLPAFVRSVQSSVRSPMSKDEIERCVQVLEKEIAPGHVSMMKFGSIVGVVVNRLCKPTDEMVHSRLTAAGAF